MKTMIGCGKAALLFGGTVILDQAVKAYVASTMLPGESIPVIPSYLHLTYVLNAGAAFGIFERQQWLFLFTAALFFLVFLFLYPRLARGSELIHYGSVAFAAGALSNMADRIRLAHVIDFIDFRVWPVFNIADIAIVVGTICVLWALFVQKKEFLP